MRAGLPDDADGRGTFPGLFCPCRRTALFRIRRATRQRVPGRRFLRGSPGRSLAPRGRQKVRPDFPSGPSSSFPDGALLSPKPISQKDDDREKTLFDKPKERWKRAPPNQSRAFRNALRPPTSVSPPGPAFSRRLREKEGRTGAALRTGGTSFLADHALSSSEARPLARAERLLWPASATERRRSGSSRCGPLFALARRAHPSGACAARDAKSPPGNKLQADNDSILHLISGNRTNLKEHKTHQSNHITHALKILHILIQIFHSFYIVF